MSHTELVTNLHQEYQSVEQVIEQFTWLEDYFFRQDDLRGVFASAYLHITRSIGAALQENTFNNNAWSHDYLIRFANLYREAIFQYELKNTDRVAKSWRMAFDLAKNDSGFIIQHLLLGINAHINHDLALALDHVSIEPNRSEKYQDHTDINIILEKATHGLKKTVANKYAPIFNRLDILLGDLDDSIIAFSIPKAREHAWSMAIALNSSHTKIERRILEKSLDEQAAVLARLILAPPTQQPKVKETVSFFKRIDQKMRHILRFFG